MTPPTAPDTGAIRQRLEKITPGPWEAEWTPVGKGYTRIIGGVDGDAYDDGSPRTISTHVCDVIDNTDEEANLDFIVHAPADIAALLAEVESRRWQPIETAPKDGTYILAYPVLNQVACVVSWQRTRGWLGCWRMPMTNEAAPYDPTHWMPLPEPPQAKEGDTP